MDPEKSKMGAVQVDSSGSLEAGGSSASEILDDKEAPEAPPVAVAVAGPPRFIPPDGGRTAWLCVAGAWCCIFVSFGWITCVGTFQDYYQTEALTEYSPQAIAWILSTEV